MTWVVIDTKTAGRHIMPEDEAEIHLPVECRCGTRFDDEARATIHSSLDGREIFERLMPGFALVSKKDEK